MVGKLVLILRIEVAQLFLAVFVGEYFAIVIFGFHAYFWTTLKNVWCQSNYGWNIPTSKMEIQKLLLVTEFENLLKKSHITNKQLAKVNKQLTNVNKRLKRKQKLRTIFDQFLPLCWVSRSGQMTTHFHLRKKSTLLHLD